ncbi:MAG: SAM-dependent DNA methyltransferase [Flavobacteriales bacterium]|nr:SAM-dependent DNA methyltransferase [Flavobacteriales bacterium]
MSEAIDQVIAQLGYSSDPAFYLIHEDRWREELSLRVQRTLEELQPYAVLCVDERPFVVFFEIEDREEELRRVHHACWNAQIPVLVVYDGDFTTYNGLALNSRSRLLNVLLKKGNHLELTLSNIRSQPFWKKHFQIKDRLDTYLLNNIESISKYLRENDAEEFSTRLILRLIFIRYLIDRGTNLNYMGFNGNQEADRGLLKHVIQEKDELYGLFKYLWHKFNGGPFVVDRDEYATINQRHLDKLSSFISGDDIDRDQPSLFDVYDFNILPIELISSIYERFLGETVKKRDEAFYTPPYLVEHILGQVFAQRDVRAVRVLDPACGSGIFLVEALRRIIEASLLSSKYLPSDELSRIADQSISGIDINKEAVEVTRFSIYVLLLDYVDPKRLLSFSMPALQGIVRSDAFTPGLPEYLSSGGQFDFVLGNPPWGNTAGSHLEYCSRRGVPQQYKEICRSFMALAEEFSGPSTIVCLIISSKILYNKSGDAPGFRRNFLLNRFELIEILELSTVRRYLFKSAIGPAAIVTYRCRRPSDVHRIRHISLKPTTFFRLFHLLLVSSSDIKEVPVELLRTHDYLWKLLLCGNLRDFEFIRRIDKETSLDDFLSSHGLDMKNGFQPSSTDASLRQDASHLFGLAYMENSRMLKHRYIFDASHLPPFRFEYGHYPRKRRIYEGPKVLIKKALIPETYDNYAVYTERDLVFNDSMSSIYGDKVDVQLLAALTLILNSKLFGYYLLMTGSSAGVEREQAFNLERLAFPVRVTEAFMAEAHGLMTEMQKLLGGDELSVEEKLSELEERAWAAVAELYEMSREEIDLVDYARKVSIPLVQGRDEMFAPPTGEDVAAYLTIYSEHFARVQKHLPAVPKLSVIGGHNHVARAVLVSFNNTDGEEEALVKLKSYLEQAMFVSQAGHIIQHHTVYYFENNLMIILKLNEKRHWNRASARVDLAELLRRSAEYVAQRT